MTREMRDGYLTPAEAAEELGISRSTITRCVKRGAPVHRWGSCGRMYRILLSEFVPWMEHQGAEAEREKVKIMTVAELRAARHKAVGQ